MCGIAGVADGQGARAAHRLQILNTAQLHRGPDHTATVRVGNISLGNTRLAIQDPTPAGNQPFSSSDGRFVCVFNGEIYNYRELIHRYGIAAGPTSCDGVLIPELWRQYGPKSLCLMRGMYGIALADRETGDLVLARDPFGIKPLYWRRLSDDTIAFASEVRPLAAMDSDPPEISRQAVARFLRLGALGPAMSPFVGIHAVPPNTVLTFKSHRDGIVLNDPLVEAGPPLLGGYDGVVSSELGQTLLEAVELHLRSDVPNVLLLSAGVDSAAIACAASRLGKTLQCVTVAGLGSADESSEAAITARAYGHDHTTVPAELSSETMVSFFKSMQRPSIDGLNTHVVCRAIRKMGWKVALSGLGGDEALGGYSHFRFLPALRILAAVDRLPPSLGRLAVEAVRLAAGGTRTGKGRRLLSTGGPRTSWDLSLLQREVHEAGRVRALTGVDPLEIDAGPSTRSTSFAELVEAEVRLYLQGTLLPDTDAFSMCSSVEMRVPFVHQPLFSLAAALGAKHPGRGKRLLARALADDTLIAITKRAKTGFSLPMAEWIAEGPLRPFVADLRETAAPVWSYVDREAAAGLIKENDSRRWSEVWALAALNAWLASVEADSFGAAS